MDALPLANQNNLKRVLSAVGQRMDVSDDLLVLFLTSHGSRDARLATRFWPLGLNDLEAPKLREMLDASGAKWRIVVVSACYSGSFIDALEDEHTLVLTAARADRTSFGCGPDSELTYFGRHFFAEALARSHSFLSAFEEARETIAERESREGKTPSEPQKFVGTQIEAKLREIEERLSQAAVSS